MDITGLTFTSIEGLDEGSDVVTFKTACGRTFIMYHEQSCCESVDIEEIHGDFNDLLNTPILQYSEDSNDAETEWSAEEWTFYNFRTIKGSVTLRWYGTSNGYYSTSVTFKELK